MNDYRCSICGGRYEKRNVTVELYTPQGELIVVKNVPAEVCVQCGDELFTAEVTHQLLEFSQKPLRPPLATLQVPVYDLAATYSGESAR